MIDFSVLNEAQQKAVRATEGAVLVLAGAGSGKTRVLTYRIAYLIDEKKIPAYRILAITFTNKATNEMKERLEKMLGENSGVWVSTFHSLCARILRGDAEKLGYTKSFTIYSDQDSDRVLKRIISNKHIEIKDFSSKVACHISNAKSLCLSPDEYRNECGDFNAGMICDVYEAYEEELKAANAMDYDDLLVKTYQLFSDFPEVLEKYANRFLYIHIDEYQDTSRLQYKIASMLAKKHGNLFAVGDEDQSIYGWRGADISNILDFKKDFPEAEVIKLEQNYRSTPNILRAANALIENNKGRFDKKLWTEADPGVRVEIYNAADDRQEAEYVVGQIASLIRSKNQSPKEFAILVRLNALSRKFEERMRLYNIPYKVYGGFKFFDRKEVKDVLAYYRAIVNPRDNDAFLRIINTPKRKIGESVTEELVYVASVNGVNVSDVLFGDMASFGMSPKNIQKLKVFNDLYFKLLAERDQMSLKEYARFVVEEAGFFIEFAGDKEEDVGRRENVNQLLEGIDEFAKDNEGATLEEYLQSVVLLSDTDDIQTDEFVTISTVHSVKGLEFDTVFVTGLEENVFPSQARSKSQKEIEEERRVMYVAMTRARKRLYLTGAKERFMYGATQYNHRSRFVDEVESKIYPDKKPLSAPIFQSNSAPKEPQRVLTDVNKYVRSVVGGASPAPHSSGGSAFKLGDKVKHPRYGVGRIIQINGDNASIAFDGLGIKQFNMKIAPLQKA